MGEGAKEKRTTSKEEEAEKKKKRKKKKVTEVKERDTNEILRPEAGVKLTERVHGVGVIGQYSTETQACLQSKRALFSSRHAKVKYLAYCGHLFG